MNIFAIGYVSERCFERNSDLHHTLSMNLDAIPRSELYPVETCSYRRYELFPSPIIGYDSSS